MGDDVRARVKIGESVRVPGCVCTACGCKLDGAAAIGQEGSVKPTAGDVTVCMECGHIMAYADSRTLRNLTDDEIKDVAGDPNILAIQRARRARGQPAFAFVRLDGQWRLTCVGCSLKLEEMGLLNRYMEIRHPDHAVAFELKPDVTLEQCRDAIRDRHVGTAWGE